VLDVILNLRAHKEEMYDQSLVFMVEMLTKT